MVYKDKILRQRWKVGRIENLLRGRYGKVRATIVKTLSEGPTYHLQRLTQRLYPIEISSQESKIVPSKKFIGDDAIQDFSTNS